MTAIFLALKDKLGSADLGDRLGVMNAGRSLDVAERFELACLAKDDANARIRYDAVSQLGELGTCDRERARGILCERLLHDPESDVRAAAADSIGALKLTEAFDALQQTYHATGDWILRFSVIASLGELGELRAYDMLVAALQDANELIAIAAIGSLGELGDPRAVEVLLPLADSPDWQVRHRTVQALAQLGGDRAIAKVTELTHDEVPQVAELARLLIASV